MSQRMRKKKYFLADMSPIWWGSPSAFSIFLDPRKGVGQSFGHVRPLKSRIFFINALPLEDQNYQMQPKLTLLAGEQ